MFDIDGTLVNAGGAGSAAFVEALSSVFGLSVEVGDYRFGGRTDAAIAHDLMARHGIDGARVTAARERLWGEYLPRLAHAMAARRPRLYEGVWELLERLARRSDLLVGVLTGNHEPAAWLKLQACGIDGYFRLGAFGGETVSRLELPARALDAARPLLRGQVPSERVVVVGDTPHDIDCARHAGMRVLAVATGRYDVDTLRSHAPDSLWSDLGRTSEVVDALEALIEGSTS